MECTSLVEEDGVRERTITCTQCGVTMGAVPVWHHAGLDKNYTHEYGYFREYEGLVLRPISMFS